MFAVPHLRLVTGLRAAYNRIAFLISEATSPLLRIGWRLLCTAPNNAERHKAGDNNEPGVRLKRPNGRDGKDRQNRKGQPCVMFCRSFFAVESARRLWPLSREAFPKQFHKITGSETLLQQTCRRLQGPPFGSLSILANHRQRFLVEEQLKEIGFDAQAILLEPVGRNTAPASCIAALVAETNSKRRPRLTCTFRSHYRRHGRLCRCRRQGHASG